VGCMAAAMGGENRGLALVGNAELATLCKGGTMFRGRTSGSGNIMLVVAALGTGEGGFGGCLALRAESETPATRGVPMEGGGSGVGTDLGAGNIERRILRKGDTIIIGQSAGSENPMLVVAIFGTGEGGPWRRLVLRDGLRTREPSSGRFSALISSR
jgi:hypothetical protein